MVSIVTPLPVEIKYIFIWFGVKRGLSKGGFRLKFWIVYTFDLALSPRQSGHLSLELVDQDKTAPRCS